MASLNRHPLSISSATSVSTAAALTAAAAAGATPTKAEFDAVVADLAAIRTALNVLVTALTS